jgi:hypothetical protein
VKQFLYYRYLSRSPAIWQQGKSQKLLPSDFNENDYLRHMKEGKGFPSFWLADTDEDLERIALGILLCKGSFDKVELLGFDEFCFVKAGINIKRVPSPDFPLQSVRDNHYELCINNNDDNKLIISIEIFLECYGCCKKFEKKGSISNNQRMNMFDILHKYKEQIVGDNYVKKAEVWVKKYSNKIEL